MIFKLEMEIEHYSALLESVRNFGFGLILLTEV